MPIFLDTRGRSTLGVGLCARCSVKYPLDELRPDGNSPGLLVCGNGCWDQLDPYRLPAPAPDTIVLPYCRPDVSIATDPAGLPTEDDSYFLTTEDSDGYLLP